MKYIPLTRGDIAIVDDKDYPRLAPHSWHRTLTGYARRSRTNAAVADGKKRFESMHYEVLGISPVSGLEVDHINGNKLDNRKKNLRVCSHSENIMNRPKLNCRLGSSSVFKGVTRSSAWVSGRWVAQIRSGGKTLYLGAFADEIDAARAYDVAARKHHGKFARLNFTNE